jgi:hypothetical protein
MGFRPQARTDRLTDLNHVIRRRIVQEALKMEDENGRKRLDLYFKLLALPCSLMDCRLARV